MHIPVDARIRILTYVMLTIVVISASHQDDFMIALLVFLAMLLMSTVDGVWRSIQVHRTTEQRIDGLGQQIVTPDPEPNDTVRMFVILGQAVALLCVVALVLIGVRLQTRATLTPAGTSSRTDGLSELTTDSLETAPTPMPTRPLIPGTARTATWVPTASAAKTAPIATAHVTPDPTPMPTPIEHVVQAGENFWCLAEKYYERGNLSSAICEFNGLTDLEGTCTSFRTGSTIKIPQRSDLIALGWTPEEIPAVLPTPGTPNVDYFCSDVDASATPTQ